MHPFACANISKAQKINLFCWFCRMSEWRTLHLACFIPITFSNYLLLYMWRSNRSVICCNFQLITRVFLKKKDQRLFSQLVQKKANLCLQSYNRSTVYNKIHKYLDCHDTTSEKLFWICLQEVLPSVHDCFKIMTQWTD